MKPGSRSRIVAFLLLASLSLGTGVASAEDRTPEEGEESGPPQEEDEFDPFEGMDPSGRIPSVERPAWVEHPERWRYIPEGRLKPGNVFQRFLVSSAIVPFLFRDSDVGIGGGLALTDIDFRNQRRQEFLGTFFSYSAEGQQSYTLAWRRWRHHIERPEGGVLQEERSFWRFAGGYRKTLTRRFFGFGPDTDESDETSYRDERIEFEFGLQGTYPDPGDALILELGVRGEFHDLGDGEVSGAPDTGDIFPRSFGSARDQNLGWLSAGARWDTRDSQRNPYRGWELGARIDAALAQSGGDLGSITSVGGSWILPLPGLFHDGGDAAEENPPTDTLAFGARFQFASGELPFFALPTLGGADQHRGFIEGRWRDRSSWFAATEYRFWVIERGFPITRTIRIERIGLAGFYEVGTVAKGARAIFRADPKQSYGVGLRISLERSALFRVDVGFSNEDTVVSAQFGLSF